MKILSSLTTMVVSLLFMTYLGVFSGWEVKNVLLLQNREQNLSAPIAEISLYTISPTPSIITNSITPTSQKNPVPTKLPSKKVIANTPAVAVNNSVKPAIPTTKSTVSPIATSAKVPTSSPTRIPTATPTSPPVDNRCIITISGNRYDVTQFRNIHSGGDIFKCGTDMTAIFLSRHPASFLQKMSQYRV